MRLVCAVTCSLLVAGAPLIAVAAAFWVGAVIGHCAAGAAWLFSLSWRVTVVLIGYVLGSFWVHEMGHAILLQSIPGIRRVDVERKLMRLSLRPHGDLSSISAIGVALAGPGAAVVIGLILLLLSSIAAWIFLAHALFFLPVFGDGRALLVAVKVGFRSDLGANDSRE